ARHARDRGGGEAYGASRQGRSEGARPGEKRGQTTLFPPCPQMNDSQKRGLSPVFAVTDPRYLSGFGAHHESEAVPGALPTGQNSPQRPPFGLYTEQVSGTAFTAPRAHNLRSWQYRLRPSAGHPPFARIDDGFVRT